MEITENRYKILSIVLIIAILAIIIFAILPKYQPDTPEVIIDKIDFSNSAWIEQYIEKSLDLFGKDFYMGTAFSYNIRSNKMIVTYASLNSVEEARENYLSLPGAELAGRNDETSLNILADINNQDLRIYNYYSSISRVFELELTLDSENSEKIIRQLEMAFPTEVAHQITEIEDVVAGEIFGGYVRYNYDQYDGFSHPNVPIFSRAYFFEGTQEDFENIIEALNKKYLENRFDDSQKANYYRINGYIISISYLVTDSEERLITLSIQQEPK